MVRLMILGSMLALFVVAGHSHNTDCRTWRPHTAQNVVVASDVGTLYWGRKCNTVLQGINLTVYCDSNATIHIDQWTMLGGYVAIVGPPEAPWNISNVAVTVTSSAILAEEGPAVGVVLGHGWANASGVGVPSVWVASNLTLVSIGSILNSVSHGVPALTVALAVAVLNDSVASTVDIELQHVFLGAQSSNLTATGIVASAVVGVAMTAGGRLRVSQCSFVVRSCTAKAMCFSTTASACASAIGGISAPQVTNVAVATVTQYIAWSTGSSSSSSNSYSASTVGGVSVAYTNAAFTLDNSTQFVAWSNANSISSCSSNSNGYIASSVGGVSIAYASAAFTAKSSTQYTAGSNVSSIGSGSSSDSNSYLYSASTVGGVSVAFADAAFTMDNSTQYVARCNATSTGGNSNSYGASNVGGVTVAHANAAFTMSTSTQCVAWSNASSSSSNPNSYVDSASTVGGVSVAYAAAALMIGNSTQCVAWSNGSSSSTSSSASSNFNSYSASTVGGVCVAYAFAAFTMEECIQYVTWSNASSTSRSSRSYDFSASTVGGISVAGAKAAFTVVESTQYVGWSSASSSSSNSNSVSGNSDSASSVSGVSVAYADASFAVDSSAQFVEWSNASSSSSGGSDSNSYSASTVGGVSVVWSRSPGTVSSRYHISRSYTQACAAGVSVHAVCGDVTATGHCCINASAADDGVAPPQLTLPLPSVPDVQVPYPSGDGWSLTRTVVRHRHMTATRSVDLTVSATTGTTTQTLTLATQRSAHGQRAITTRRRQASLTLILRRSLRTRHSPSTFPPLVVPKTAPPSAPVTRPAIGLDGTAARAVVAIGYGSSAVAATLSPTSANKPSVVSRAVRAATCAVLDGDRNTFPTADTWSLLPSAYTQPSSTAGPSGNVDAASRSAGMLLSTLVVAATCLTCSCAIPWLCPAQRRRGRDE